MSCPLSSSDVPSCWSGWTDPLRVAHELRRPCVWLAGRRLNVTEPTSDHVATLNRHDRWVRICRNESNSAAPCCRIRASRSAAQRAFLFVADAMSSSHDQGPNAIHRRMSVIHRTLTTSPRAISGHRSWTALNGAAARMNDQTSTSRPVYGCADPWTIPMISDPCWRGDPTRSADHHSMTKHRTPTACRHDVSGPLSPFWSSPSPGRWCVSGHRHGTGRTSARSFSISGASKLRSWMGGCSRHHRRMRRRLRGRSRRPCRRRSPSSVEPTCS